MMQYWAVALAAVAWFLIQRIVSQRAHANSQGKVMRPTRYSTGRGLLEITWDCTEQACGHLTVFVWLLLAIPLILLNLGAAWWTGGVLLFMSFLLLGVWTIDDIDKPVFMKEVDREQTDEEGVVNITYQRETQTATKRDAIRLGVIVSCWLSLFWLLKHFITDSVWLTAVFGAALLVALWVAHLIGRRDQQYRESYRFAFCKRCGGRLKHDTRPEVTREYRGGNRYIERTNLAVYEICRVCGQEREL